MRPIVSVVLVFLAFASSAQPRHRAHSGAEAGERALSLAARQLELMKSTYDRDIAVLGHLRAAQEAVADAMQPSAAVEKAHGHLAKAEGLLESGGSAVYHPVLEALQALESARRSPSTADFDRLRGLILRAAVPASRVAARNALDLEEQILDWIKVQQGISDHLRRMSEIAGESLRASQ